MFIRMTFAILCLGWFVPGVARAIAAEQDKGKEVGYQSPYSVKFSFTPKELLNDIDNGPRGRAHEESLVPFADWYSPKVREKYGAWGPPARVYAPPEGLALRSAAWKRQRVIAVALRFQGYSYQHHHIPDWDPPADWPWKETKSGQNGKGVDCSNFTAFAYNQGLGIKFTGDIKKQSTLTEVPGAKDAIRLERIEKPKTHAEWQQVLQTGDLLFIRNRKGEIGHVVFWVGGIGHSPDKTPLILDSHGEGVKDCNDKSIPHGVYLRPFRENAWYSQSASHALRIVHSD